MNWYPCGIHAADKHSKKTSLLHLRFLLRWQRRGGIFCTAYVYMYASVLAVKREERKRALLALLSPLVQHHHHRDTTFFDTTINMNCAFSRSKQSQAGLWW